MVIGPFQFLFNENANIFFQDIGTPLWDSIFKVLTNAGSEPAYILLVSLIFWCLNKKTGIRVMYAILFSAYIVIFAKNLFGMPRPPAYLHKVIETDFGFPSGHAQISSSFWGYLGLRSKKTRIIMIGAIAVFLVSLSRIYLGVHYPGDVVGGIILGLSVAFISYRCETGILKIFENQKHTLKYFAALFIPTILVFIASLQGSDMKEQMELGLLMASVGFGYLLEEEKIGFSDVKNNKQVAKRALIGISISGSVYVISEILSLINPVFIIIKYGALGFSSVFIVPWAFTRLEGGKKLTTTLGSGVKSN